MEIVEESGGILIRAVYQMAIGVRPPGIRAFLPGAEPHSAHIAGIPFR